MDFSVFFGVRSRLHMLWVAVALCVEIMAPFGDAQSQVWTAPTAVAANRARIQRYCVGCHNNQSKTAGVTLQGLDLSTVADKGELVERVLRKVKTGQMPPAGLPRPNGPAGKEFRDWREGALDAKAAAHPNPGHPPFHRLNRAECSNAVRDTFDLEFAGVDLLIHGGANVSSASKSGFMPLVFAALNNDARLVQRLLAASANPNVALPDEAKVLTTAVSNSSYAASLALVDGGADPNVTDRTGRTPLHDASQSGALDLVRNLLAKGAKPNVQTAPAAPVPFRALAGGQTPLLLAARVEVMRALIQAGADTNLKAQDGASLLLAAAASSRVVATKYAFEFDKDVQAVDSSGLTAMHECASNPGSGATQEDRTELFSFSIAAFLSMKKTHAAAPIQTGDPTPLDKPIQRMADIVVNRGVSPVQFPKEYVKPGFNR
jgi:ankyrin repeat protein